MSLKSTNYLIKLLRTDSITNDMLEGKMIGKPARGRKRLNILSDLAEFKARAEDRKGWHELKRAGIHIASHQIT